MRPARAWLLLCSCLLHGVAAADTPPPVRFSLERCASNPLITPASHADIGDNINGPSVMRAPAWLPHRLGRYYMYFAHHRGDAIRLATADAVCGPWRVHPRGALALREAPGMAHHIASPDVHVDEENRRIYLYFHGRAPDGSRRQHSGVALSRDGVRFEVLNVELGAPYLRLFRWQDQWLALAQSGGGGVLLHGQDRVSPFAGGMPIIPRMRHAAVLPLGNDFLVLFSRIGDAPERILAARLRFDGSSLHPQLSRITEVIAPRETYEGVRLPVHPSRRGPTHPAHQLRDPAVLVDAGDTWLFYAIAGENGIAAARLSLLH